VSITGSQAAAQAKPRSSRSVGDMVRSLGVVAVVVIALVLVNYRSPTDPVHEVDAAAIASEVAAAAAFPVLLPTQPGWRPTAARWEPTEASGAAPVWFAGGVFSEQGPFASVSESQAASAEYLQEQTRQGSAAGSVTVSQMEWQRFESPTGDRSLVRVTPTGSIVVMSSGTWQDLETFAASLRPVAAPAG
jgi:hypothetical protein